MAKTEESETRPPFTGPPVPLSLLVNAQDRGGRSSFDYPQRPICLRL